MRYRHFFWDFDGTLYDTYGRITRAVAKGLGDLGVQVSEEVLYPAVKQSLDLSFYATAQGRGFSLEDFRAAYHAHSEEEGPESIRPYPGTPEALRAVIAGGGYNYLYTHRGESVFRWLRYDGLESLFTDSVTSLDGFPAKPAPDALNYLIEKHGLNRTECVMTGDRSIDLDAAKNAGISCALFDPENFYPDYDTPWRFKTMQDLVKALCSSA